MVPVVPLIPLIASALKKVVIGSLVLFIFLGFGIPRTAAQEPGVLRIGADVDYRPYSFVDSSGEPSGFDIELMRLVAERLGLTPEFTLDSWNSVLNALEKGRIDVAVGALFTISRTEHFIFTEPYNTDTVSIFVREDSPIDSLRDLGGRTAAVFEGDAIPETVLNTSGIDSDTETFASLTGALSSVSRGTADYSLVPYAVGLELAEKAGIDNLRVAGPPVYTIQYRLAVGRSREGFRDQLNRELDALIDTEAYGELQDRWLRHRRRELSLEETARLVAPFLVPGIVLLLTAWVWTLKRQVVRQTRELTRQSAELKAQATQDELTGLANRRLFDAITEKEFPRSQRRGEAFAILFMDLDHFKVVNDTHGHPVGDTILKEFSRRASGELREYDILARYGGEEFVALLRDADREEALAVAERILQASRSKKYSIGPERDQSFRQVMSRADQALYDAKHAGRDRVEPR
jgi:diguanylate cyclase (GGDEF)-like protein